MNEPETNRLAPAAAAQRDGVGPDAAVDLDRDVPARLLDPSPDLLDHRQLLGHELLAAETGMDRHDQDHVDMVEVVVDRLGGRAWAEAEAGAATGGADVLERLPRVLARFHVDDHVVGAGFGVPAGVAVRIGDHQMRFERFPGERACGAQDGEAESQVGHEVAVHHVDLEAVDITIHGLDLRAQAREVAIENRRYHTARHVSSAVRETLLTPRRRAKRPDLPVSASLKAG